jgi:hypothetical protein
MGNLLWLASYPKSGNTWIRAFLANLVANRPAPLPLGELPAYCDDDARAELYSLASGRSSTALSIEEICALRPSVHAQLAAAASGTLFVKTHNYWGGFEGFPLHNAQVTAGGIHVVRNPLDVAVSMTHHFGLSVDEAIAFMANEGTATENEGRWVTQLLGSWSSHVGSWADIDHASFLTVRYEDLVDKPGKSFARIAKLVGVTDRARIERAVRHAGFETLAKLERRDGFIEASEKTNARFFRAGRANQWRTALDRDQISRIVDAHRARMVQFKYVPAGY